MSKKVTGMDLREYLDFVGICSGLDNYDIAAIETYIELKLKDQEFKLTKPYMTNIKGDRLYPNQLEPFKVTSESSGLFSNKKTENI